MGCRPNIPEHMPKAFQDLMVECWDTDPEKRPPFEEVLKRLQVSVSCLCSKVPSQQPAPHMSSMKQAWSSS